MKSTSFKNLPSLLLNGVISGLITAVFMLLVYHFGLDSVAAGLCIGFFAYIAVYFYKTGIERNYFRKINLILLFLVNTAVIAMIILIIAMFFVGIFYLKGDFSLYFSRNTVLFSPGYMIGLAFGLMLSMTFNFLTIISTLLGKNVLGKLLLGKYRKPLEEERIFMFLDIASSTSIAEKIGHMKYLSMLNDFFYDIVEPIHSTKGEIYKYVGDEVIITWKMKSGVKEARCLECFFLIRDIIRKRSEEYMKKYGLVPGFKAGLHGGIAVIGEVGFVRREIAFVGDVLNTTARIESECQNFGQSLLISDHLAMKLTATENYRFNEVGTVVLRGKEKAMKLFGVEPA